MTKRKIKNEISGFIFAMPVILGVLIFTYYPAAKTLYYAFTNFNGANRCEFVGFKMFEIMFRDIDTPLVFRNTFIYALVSVPLNMLLGYMLALLANWKLKGVTVFRVLFYLPVIIPGVASALVFKDLLSTGSEGVINMIAGKIGLHFSFFDSEHTAMVTLLYMNSWVIGGSMIMWLAAFKNIPDTLYESAKLDGAGAFRRLISITIPMSTSMIFYNLVTGVIGALQTNQTLVLFAGGNGAAGLGPEKSLYFVCVKIYNEAFGNFRQGYASAFAWFLFMIIAVFTALIFKTNKWVYYGDGD